MFQGLDADQDLSAHAGTMKAAGLSFAMRYLKNLSVAEVTALHGAGLKIGAVFETAADRAFGGTQNGMEDGARALQQMRQFTDLRTAAIFPAVDGDVPPGMMDAVVDYFAAFDSKVFGSYDIGGYAGGSALEDLLAHGLSYPWLAGAMGWAGSRDFDTANRWVIKQGPTLHAGGEWDGMVWPNLGFAYDPDVATKLDAFF